MTPQTSQVNRETTPVSLAGSQYNYSVFRKSFDRAYNQWYHSGNISSQLLEKVTSQIISVDDFKKIDNGTTINKIYCPYWWKNPLRRATTYTARRIGTFPFNDTLHLMRVVLEPCPSAVLRMVWFSFFGAYPRRHYSPPVTQTAGCFVQIR